MNGADRTCFEVAVEAEVVAGSSPCYSDPVDLLDPLMALQCDHHRSRNPMRDQESYFSSGLNEDSGFTISTPSLHRATCEYDADLRIKKKAIRSPHLPRGDAVLRQHDEHILKIASISIAGLSIA